MEKVFITRKIPESGIELLKAKFEVDVWDGELPPPRAELLRRVKGCGGLLTMLSDKIDSEVFAAAGASLKVVTNYAVGYDNIDLAASAKLGLRVGNTPGVLTETTADLAFALLMSVARRIVEGNQYVQDNRWKTWGPELLRGYDLSGKTLGIVGFGRIGQAMAKRGLGFNMPVLFYSPTAPKDVYPELNATKADLDRVLREADFLSLHCPLNDRSRKLINAEALAKMKDTAILVNTARGPVVDSKALFDALSSGKLAGAGLDVTDPEPILADDPLLKLSNVVITPHIGSASYETRAKMSEMSAENIIAGIEGKPLPFEVKLP